MNASFSSRIVSTILLTVTALCVAACEADEGSAPIGVAVQEVRSPTEPDHVQPNGDVALQIFFTQKIHELTVQRCDAECEIADEYCSFGQSTEVWATGVGNQEWAANEVDEPRLDPPTIDSGVTYGHKPAGAGYSTSAEPLVDGRYAVWMDVYDGCDQGYEAGQCLHSAAYGCHYFDVVDGRIVTR